MKLPPNSASRLPGPSGNQLEKVHGKSEERYNHPAALVEQGNEQTGEFQLQHVLKCGFIHIVSIGLFHPEVYHDWYNRGDLPVIILMHLNISGMWYANRKCVS